MANERINEQTELLQIEQKKVGEVKSGTNSKGKQWSLTQVSIKAGGVWYNGAIFDQKELEEFKAISEDKQHYFKTWLEEYQGSQYNKFALLKETDKLQLKVDELMTFRRFMLSDAEVMAKYNKFKAQN